MSYVKVQFKGGWALVDEFEFKNTKNKYKLYVEPKQEVKEEKITEVKKAEVKKNVASGGKRTGRK